MIRRLDRLSAGELKRAGRMRNDSKALIIMHPYSLDLHAPAFERFIRTRAFGNILTVIFQPASETNWLRARLAGLGAGESDSLFLVATKEIIPGKSYLPKIDLATPTCGWQKVFGRLDSLGVKDITVDGKHLSNFGLEGLTADIKRERGRQKRRALSFSQMRAFSTAARKAGSPTAYGYCVGLAWSRFVASGKYAVRIRRRFR